MRPGGSIPVVVTQPKPLPNSPVSWWIEQQPNRQVFLHFRCAVCGDHSQRPCQNVMARGDHWIALYAMGHPPYPHRG